MHSDVLGNDFFWLEKDWVRCSSCLTQIFQNNLVKRSWTWLTVNRLLLPLLPWRTFTHTRTHSNVTCIFTFVSFRNCTVLTVWQFLFMIFSNIFSDVVRKLLTKLWKCRKSCHFNFHWWQLKALEPTYLDLKCRLPLWLNNYYISWYPQHLISQSGSYD